ncbi:MAG: hypothetical protein JXA50_02080 [Deltaproteobacteria bacterium]|nr:hypothetical protein [Deltaproteobacteria bacterium]
MKKHSKSMWPLSLLVLIAVFIMTFPLYADQSQGFDRQKVKLLTDAAKESKAEVKTLFGEPTTTAPIKKTEEGCIELWIYTKVIMDGITLVKTEFLYVGFDEAGYVCSAEVTDEKN